VEKASHDGSSGGTDSSSPEGGVYGNPLGKYFFYHYPGPKWGSGEDKSGDG